MSAVPPAAASEAPAAVPTRIEAWRPAPDAAFAPVPPRAAAVVTRSGYGYGEAGMVDQFVALANAMIDLPLENATDVEMEKIATLRSGLLEKRGLAKAPTEGWGAQHYTSH
eukprot:6115055-Prymnesium_polylepis.1